MQSKKDLPHWTPTAATVVALLFFSACPWESGPPTDADSDSDSESAANPDAPGEAHAPKDASPSPPSDAAASTSSMTCQNSGDCNDTALFCGTGKKCEICPDNLNNCDLSGDCECNG